MVSTAFKDRQLFKNDNYLCICDYFSKKKNNSKMVSQNLEEISGLLILIRAT